MSEYGTGQPSSAGGSAAGTAKDEAAGVARSAAQSGQHLAGEAKTQAAEVGREAGRQAKDILQTGRNQLAGQLSGQHDKAADSLRSLSKELQAMASGEPTEPGLGADIARQVSQRVESVATWIETHEPSEVLDEVKRFARQRPGTFLAIAAGAGLLAGRLTRGVKDANSDDTSGQGQVGAAGSYGSAYGTGSTYGTGPTYGTGSAYDTTSSVGTGAQYATVTSGTLAGTAAGAPLTGVEGGLEESTYASSGYSTEGSSQETLAYDTPAAGTYGTTEVPERQDDDLAWPPVHGEGEQR